MNLCYTDTGNPMNDGDTGYWVNWRTGVIGTVRRYGTDLVDLESKGVYVGAGLRPCSIVFKHHASAVASRDMASDAIGRAIFAHERAMLASRAVLEDTLKKPVDTKPSVPYSGA